MIFLRNEINLVNSIYNQRISMRISQKRLVEDTIQMVQAYGQKYAYLIPLLSSNSPEEFYKHLTAIGQLDQRQINKRQNFLYGSQFSRISFLINGKLKKLIDSQSVDFRKLIPAFEYMKESFLFQLYYESLKNGQLNIFDMFDIMNRSKVRCDMTAKVRQQFLQNNLDALYNNQKDTFNYRCMRTMKEEAKRQFQIRSVNEYNHTYTKKNIEKSKLIYEKYIQTESPRLFFLLLDNQYEEMNKAKQQIVKLSLYFDGQIWKLVGNFRVNKKCLTAANLIKCISTYDYNYRYLYENLFIENDDHIVFKYDVLNMNISKKPYFFMKFSQLKDPNEVKDHLYQIIVNAILLMNNILSNKKLFIFNGNGGVDQIPTKRTIEAIFFCLKLITFPFRVRYSNGKIDKDKKITIPSGLDFQIPIDDLRRVLCRFIKDLIDKEQSVNVNIINNLCELFRWMDESKGYQTHTLQLFTGQDQQVSLNTLFGRLILKTFNKDEFIEIPYHMGIWIIKFLTNELSPQSTLEKSYCSLCISFYKFLIKQNKYYSIYDFQLAIRVSPLQLQQQFLKKVDICIKNNPKFTQIIYDNWLKQLEYLQKNQNYEQSQSERRLQMLALIVKDQNFPITEIIKEKIINFLHIQLFTRINRLISFNKTIWQGCFAKINLDISMQISFCLDELEKDIYDHDLIARTFPIIWFSYRKPKDLLHLLVYLSKLKIMTSLVDTTESHAKRIVHLVLHNRIIKSKYQFSRRSLLEPLSLSDLQWYSELQKRGFSTDVQDAFDHNESCIRYNLELTKDIIVCNSIIKQLGVFIAFLNNNYQNPYIAASVIQVLHLIILNISNKQKGQFFPQFYNYHKQSIIDLLQKFFSYYQFKFTQKYDQNLSECKQIKFTINLRKGKQDFNTEWEKQNVLYLQKEVKQFISNMFTCQKWQSTILINNIRYKNTNSKRLFQKSIQSDLIQRLATRYSPQKLFLCRTIFNNLSYNSYINNILQCQKEILQIEVPTDPVVVFEKRQEFEEMLFRYEHFLQKIFDCWQNCNDLTYIEQLYKGYISTLKEEHMKRINESTLKKLFQFISNTLPSPDFQWPKYYQANRYIYLILKYYEEPIRYLLSKQSITLYFSQLLLDLQNDIFIKYDPEPFIKIMERMIPISTPKDIDKQFKKFANTALLIYRELQKYMKSQETIPFIKKLLAKIFSIKNWEQLYEEQVFELFKDLHETKDAFSELLCELIHPQLIRASIQLEIKCYFLKHHETKLHKESENRIKLADLVQTFQQKHKNNIKQFIQVVQKLAKKKIINEQNQRATYLLLNNNLEIGQSVYLGTNFIDYKFSKVINLLLSSYIQRIGQDKDLLILKLQQLRIITFNFPILTAFILMHPYKSQDKIIPFIEYLLNRIDQDLDQKYYQFFSYLCLDLTLIFKHQGKNIFFSEYVCYRIITYLMEIPRSKKSLLFIFNMTKIKRFADLCFKKINDGYSLCDYLWQQLKDCNGQKECSNILLLSILSLLYRQNSLHSIRNYFQYQKGSHNEWSKFSGFVNQCLIPFKSIVLKVGVKQDQCFNINKSNNLVNKDSYYYFNQMYPKWYSELDYQTTEMTHRCARIHEIKYQQTVAKDQYMQHIGDIIESSNDRWFDIETNITLSYFDCHQQLFNAFYLICLQNCKQKEISNEISKLGQPQFKLFQVANQADKKQDDKKIINYILQDEMNRIQQSSFAPQDFINNHSIQAQQQKERSLLKQLEEHIQPVKQSIQNQPKLRQNIQFTVQMNTLFGQINEKLQFLKKKPMTIYDIQGQTTEQMLQYLKKQFYQIDFDFKQATMSIEQFSHYCLSNANSLQRLDSERRNKVMIIEESMLLQYVQRSFSSDSVGYIIDTIDQNYQHLSRKKIQMAEVYLPPRRLISKRSIPSAIIPLDVFQDISDQNLHRLILSIYQESNLIPSDYLTPFIQNKKVQAKIINTLLYISKRPFENPHFPNVTSIFDLGNLIWSVSEASLDDTSQMRSKILKILQNGMYGAFYEEQNIFNKQVSNIKIIGIQQQQNNELNNSDKKTMQIYEIFDLIMNQKGSQDTQVEQYSKIFSFFRGISDISSQLLQKVIQLLKQIHKLCKDNAQNQQQQIDSGMISTRINQENCFQIQNNLSSLLRIQRNKQQIRKAFPLNVEDIDPFFVCLLMNTGVYHIQQLQGFHKEIIQKDEAKSGSVYFANQAFKLYSNQQLRQCFWIKQNKNTIISMIKSLHSHDLILKEQPFYRLYQFPQLITLQFKSEILYRKVFDYQKQFTYHGKSDIVAQRKKGIFQSAFLDLKNKPDGFWYEDFSVKFMNEQDQLESGYGNGVAKDWYSLVTKGMVNLNYGIFMKTSKNYYFFNRQSWINPRHLQFLEFIGKIFALSIIKSQCFIAPSFSILLYKMIVGQAIEADDIIKEFDEGQVINNVQKLRDLEDDSLMFHTFVFEDKRLIANKNIQTLQRRKTGETDNKFYLIQESVEVIKEIVNKKNEMREEEITEKDISEESDHFPINQDRSSSMLKILKVGSTIQLIPGGANIPVTLQNIQQFITLTKRKILELIVNDIRPQFNAFMSGFRRIVKPQFIQNLTANDLRKIAEGSDKISIADLKAHVSINKSLADSALMQWFWRCLESLDDEDKAYFIQHWTGLPKIPAEGFKGMNLQIVKGGKDQRLYAQTCFNKMHLPECESQEKLREAVTMVINSIKIGESIIQD